MELFKRLQVETNHEYQAAQRPQQVITEHHIYLIIYRLIATAINDYQELLSSYIAQNNELQV